MRATTPARAPGPARRSGADAGRVIELRGAANSSDARRVVDGHGIVVPSFFGDAGECGWPPKQDAHADVEAAGAVAELAGEIAGLAEELRAAGKKATTL